MKRTSKRLLALILALCMALSLLSASVWAAEVSDDLTVVSSDGSEAESAEAPAEAEPEEEPEESDAEEPEAEPEESDAEEPEAEPEESDAEEPEAEPEESDVSDEEAAEPAEAEPEAEEAEAPEQEAEESAAEESAAAQAAETHTHKDAKGETITFEPWDQAAVNEQYANSTQLLEVAPADVEYTPTNCLPKSGSYYLTENVTLTDTHTIESGSLNLCLNGKSITRTSQGEVFRVAGGAVLNLFDENGNAGKITHGKDGSGNVYSGCGVYVTGNAKFNLYGGTISGNKNKESSGGGVYVYNGSFTMNGGTIEGNTADYGGGVYAYESSITMSGGTIEGNTANFRGGGVLAYESSITMSGGSIEGNEASKYGGGVYVHESSITMSGGTIKGNSAEDYGGGVDLYNSTFTMNGGTISGNVAKDEAGGVEVEKGSTFIMKGGSIEGNSTQDYGGGVANYHSRVFLTGGTISGNKASLGGGVFNYGSSDVLMLGGTIKNNTAEASSSTGMDMAGGGVFNSGIFCISNNEDAIAGILGQDFVIEGLSSSGAPSITDNKATFGGGVLNAAGCFYCDTGSIKSNTAQTATINGVTLGGGGGIFDYPLSIDSELGSLSAAEAGGRHGDPRQEQVKSASSLPSGVYLSGNPTISGNTDSEGQDNLVLTAQEAVLEELISGAVDAQSEQYSVEPIHIMGKLTNTTPIGVTILLQKNSRDEGVEDLQAAAALNIQAERVGDVFTTGLPGEDSPFGDASNFVSDSADFAVTLVTEDGDLKGEAQLVPVVKASAEDVTVNYDGKAHSITVKTETEGAKVVYSTDDGKNWSETNPSFTEAGKYTVSYKAEAEGYAPATGKATVTIKSEAVKASAEDVTATYDGKAHSITVKTETKGAKVSYSTDGKTWSGTNPGFTDAGKYTVSYKAEAEGSVPATGKATVIINAKAVTATADNKSSVYNKTLATLTFNVTGLVKDADKDSLKITASTKAKKGSDVGEYDITLKQDTTKASKNYKVTLKKGTYTITKATQSAPAAPKVSQKYWTYFTVKKVKGREYRLSGKKWGSSRTFENLSPGMTYKVYARKAADKNHFASKASVVTKVKLPAAHLSANAAQTGSTLTVKWSKDPKANSYDVYVWYCGDKKPAKPTVTKTKKADNAIITKVNDEMLDTKKSITVKVVAKKNNVAVAKSLALHVAGSGSRNKTNATGINGMPKNNKLVLDLNKSKKLKLTARKNGKRGLLSEKHGAAIRLVSSDDRIISVDGTTVKAVGKGTCKVYVCTLNGIEKTIEITVK